jgi:hypothetical protein
MDTKQFVVLCLLCVVGCVAEEAVELGTAEAHLASDSAEEAIAEQEMAVAEIHGEDDELLKHVALPNNLPFANGVVGDVERGWFDRSG